jgi:hypothetical protein
MINIHNFFEKIDCKKEKFVQKGERNIKKWKISIKIKRKNQ